MAEDHIQAGRDTPEGDQAMRDLRRFIRRARALGDRGELRAAEALYAEIREIYHRLPEVAKGMIYKDCLELHERLQFFRWERLHSMLDRMEKNPDLDLHKQFIDSYWSLSEEEQKQGAFQEVWERYQELLSHRLH